MSEVLNKALEREGINSSYYMAESNLIILGKAYSGLYKVKTEKPDLGKSLAYLLRVGRYTAKAAIDSVLYAIGELTDEKKLETIVDLSKYCRPQDIGNSDMDGLYDKVLSSMDDSMMTDTDTQDTIFKLFEMNYNHPWFVKSLEVHHQGNSNLTNLYAKSLMKSDPRKAIEVFTNGDGDEVSSVDLSEFKLLTISNSKKSHPKETEEIIVEELERNSSTEEKIDFIENTPYPENHLSFIVDCFRDSEVDEPYWLIGLYGESIEGTENLKADILLRYLEDRNSLINRPLRPDEVIEAANKNLNPAEQYRLYENILESLLDNNDYSKASLYVGMLRESNPSVSEKYIKKLPISTPLIVNMNLDAFSPEELLDQPARKIIDMVLPVINDDSINLYLVSKILMLMKVFKDVGADEELRDAIGNRISLLYGSVPKSDSRIQMVASVAKGMGLEMDGIHDSKSRLYELSIKNKNKDNRGYSIDFYNFMNNDRIRLDGDSFIKKMASGVVLGKYRNEGGLDLAKEAYQLGSLSVKEDLDSMSFAKAKKLIDIENPNRDVDEAINALWQSIDLGNEAAESLLDEFESCRIIPKESQDIFVERFQELLKEVDYIEDSNESLEKINIFRRSINQYDNSGSIKALIYESSIDSNSIYADPFNLGEIDGAGKLTRSLIELFLSSKIHIDDLEDKLIQIAKAKTINERLDQIDSLQTLILDEALATLAPNLRNTGAKIKENEIQEVRAQLATIITKTSAITDISERYAKNGKLSLDDIVKSIDDASIISPLDLSYGEVTLKKGVAGEFDGLVWDDNDSLCVVMATADRSGDIEGDSILRHPLAALVLEKTVFRNPRDKDSEMISVLSDLLNVDSSLGSIIKYLNGNPHISTQIIEASMDGTISKDIELMSEHEVSDRLYSYLEENLNSFFYGSISKGNPTDKPIILNQDEFGLNAVDEAAIFYMIAHHIKPNGKVNKSSSMLSFGNDGSFTDLTKKIYKNSFALHTNVKAAGKQNRTDQKSFLDNPEISLVNSLMKSNGFPEAKSATEHQVSHIDVTLRHLIEYYRHNSARQRSDLATGGFTLVDLSNKISEWPYLSENTKSILNEVSNPIVTRMKSSGKNYGLLEEPTTDENLNQYLSKLSIGDVLNSKDLKNLFINIAEGNIEARDDTKAHVYKIYSSMVLEREGRGIVELIDSVFDGSNEYIVLSGFKKEINKNIPVVKILIDIFKQVLKNTPDQRADLIGHLVRECQITIKYCLNDGLALAEILKSDEQVISVFEEVSGINISGTDKKNDQEVVGESKKTKDEYRFLDQNKR